MKAKPPSLRERQKAQTRKLLIDSAATLFAENGYNETTIDDIAAAAGTSRATVYSYFPSKDAIIGDLIVTMWDEAESLYTAFGELADWSEPTISAWLGEVVGAWEAGIERLRVNASGLVRYEDFYLEYHERYVRALTANAELWQHFKPDEARRRALLLVNSLETFLNTWLVRGWEMDRANTIDTMTEVWRAVLKAS